MLAIYVVDLILMRRHLLDMVYTNRALSEPCLSVSGRRIPPASHAHSNLPC
jgi:hypothetical protein